MSLDLKYKIGHNMDIKAAGDRPLILQQKREGALFPVGLDYCYPESLYLGNGMIDRILRKVILRGHIYGLERILFRSWDAYLDQINMVILIDTGNAPYICDYIRRRNPQVRLILWYWNPIACSIPIERFRSKDIEIWSFDPRDCEIYGLRRNTQFFIPENLQNLQEMSGSDVYYVGVDKNRAATLAKFAEALDSQQISHRFHLVKYKNSTNHFGIEYQQPITYKEVLSNIQASKAVLDLVGETQSGLTLRPLEALFMKKKLITNMSAITEYDIYNPSNIFILGRDDSAELKDFINSPYDETDRDALIDKYSCKSWLNRFNA